MAAKRNYQPFFRRLINNIIRYATRYQSLLRAGMTPDQAAALTVFIEASNEMIAALGPEDVGP